MRHAWTEDEDRVLRKFYPVESPLAVACRLERSVVSVVHRARKFKIASGRFWSPAEDAQLRAGWGKVPVQELARQIGRPTYSLKNRAFRLRLKSGRRYTDAEKALVRQMYPTHTAAQIAEKVHGTPRAAGAIFRLAHQLGLRKWPSFSPEVVEAVRAAHAEGLNDREISDRVGIGRRSVAEMRQNRLKLPVNAASLAAAKKRGVATQMRVLGLNCPAELRSRAFRRFAEKRGWPGDLRPREVQILETLVAGPLTRRQLAEALGMSAVGTRNALKSNGSAKAGGAGTYRTTYLSELMHRGLVLYQLRTQPSGRQGIGRLPGLYWLTPAALAVIIRRAEGHGTAQQRDVGADGDRAAAAR